MYLFCQNHSLYFSLIAYLIIPSLPKQFKSEIENNMLCEVCNFMNLASYMRNTHCFTFLFLFLKTEVFRGFKNIFKRLIQLNSMVLYTLTMIMSKSHRTALWNANRMIQKRVKKIIQVSMKIKETFTNKQNTPYK